MLFLILGGKKITTHEEGEDVQKLTVTRDKRVYSSSVQKTLACAGVLSLR